MKKTLMAMAATAAAGLCLALSPAAASTVAAAPATSGRAALQSAADSIVDAGITGAVIRVSDRGRTTTVTAGVRDLATGARLHGDEEVRIGSLTKTFMSVLTLQLASQKRLSLDDTVEEWLPGLVPDGRAITLRMLLDHTSGIPDYTEDVEFLSALIGDAAATGTMRAVTPAEAVSIGTSRPSPFTPGSQFSYSNTNYVLLGLVIEKAGKAPVSRQLEQRITRPLGLTHTYLPRDGGFRGRPAHGYVPGALVGRDVPFVDATSWDPSWAGTAGAMVSTARDLDRFYSALLQGRVLPRRVLQQMQTPGAPSIDDTYGLGLFAVHAPCGTFWGHNGGIPGYASNAFSSPDGSRTAVLLTPTEVTEETFPAVNSALGTALCG